MAKVNLTREAEQQFRDLPKPIKARVLSVAARLANWPRVSGAKALRGALQGNFRIRTGDYRVVFSVSDDAETVTIWKIGSRRDVYD
jgi:mRNA interferase RelE/StbE